jgi:hypothetical protein
MQLLGVHGIGRALRGIAFALAIFAVGAGYSHAQSLDVALEHNVYDADRGVRATITYRPEVPTGGMDEIVNSDGSVSTLYWDGFLGQFTAQITQGSIAGSDAEAFLREAIIVVCPSVGRDQLEREWVQVDGPFLRIFAQCPEADAALD